MDSHIRKIAQLITEDPDVLAENWLGWQSPPDGEKLLKALERWDSCDHVSENPESAYMVGTEDDSFGPVGKTIYCQPCFNAEKEEENNRLEFCQDCKEKKKEVSKWRWHDFYAAQGDEPLMICKECWGKDRHRLRMTSDAEDRQAELGYPGYGEATRRRRASETTADYEEDIEEQEYQRNQSFWNTKRLQREAEKRQRERGERS